jgi:hypothetical protein
MRGDRERNLIGEHTQGRAGSRGKEREHAPRMPLPERGQVVRADGSRHMRDPYGPERPPIGHDDADSELVHVRNRGIRVGLPLVARPDMATGP